MRDINKYKRLEKELDKIILSEITDRFSGKRKKRNPGKILGTIEKKNREIVRLHQQRRIASNLPVLFKAYLQLQEDGYLCFHNTDLDKSDVEPYHGKKGRLEVLINASLNAMQEDELMQIVYQKKKVFYETFLKAREVMALTEKAQSLTLKADEIGAVLPKDEDSAISCLRSFAPLRAELQQIESQYIALRQDDYIGEVLQHLQNAIHLAAKNITAKRQRTARFVFDQAKAIFQKHKSAKTRIGAVEDFIAQKEALLRYHKLFEGIGDQSRQDQTGFFISAIEKNIGKLQTHIQKEKQQETAISEKHEQEAKGAYARFLEIRKMYTEGELETRIGKKKAVSQLKKCTDILKSNGQRVRAMEIERFLSATEIAKSSDTDAPPPPQNLFYKRAFLAILPVTIILLVFSAYHLISGDKANERHPAAVTEKRPEKKETPAKQQTTEHESLLKKKADNHD